MVVSCVTFWHEKRWILKQNLALGEKTECSTYVIHYASWPQSFADEGQADFLKILFSSALETDCEVLFMYIL